jgi:hypothetical protein
MGMGQNLVPLVNIKIAGKWMFIPLKMVLIGIDPYPYNFHKSFQSKTLTLNGLIYLSKAPLTGGTVDWCLGGVSVVSPMCSPAWRVCVARGPGSDYLRHHCGIFVPISEWSWKTHDHGY